MLHPNRISIVLLAFFLLGGLSPQLPAQESKKFQKDRKAILSLAGCYHITFDFAETFAPDTSYEFHDPYHAKGQELVLVIEDQPKKISLQHLLIINDTTIIKHWRQDWIYEAQNLLEYQGDNQWTTTHYPESAVRGTWTQKVYQVDDGPRYESFGKWTHVNDRHYWEGIGDAPLPRREFSKRSDYNVVNRRSHFELTDYGWIFEQDNQKVIRNNGTDSLLVWEKGHEKFINENLDCTAATDYWKRTSNYWEVVRNAWSEVFEEHPTFRLETKNDKGLLYQRLFEMSEREAHSPAQKKKTLQEVKRIIMEHLSPMKP